MTLASPGLEVGSRACATTQAVDWNGKPFLIQGPVRRTPHIVRTKVVSAELACKYNAEGWPRHLILMREFTLTLPGDSLVLKIVTNADEAEDELPDRIVTRRRDIGTFREATVVWRDRPVASFVSARLKAVVSAAPAVPAVPPPEPEPSAAHRRILEDVLRSGIVMRNDQITDALKPDERLLVNLLIAHHADDPGRPLSLAEIGRHLGVSDETIRRRRDALLRRHPHLKRPLAVFRRLNNKGGHPDAMHVRAAASRTDDAAEG